MTAQPTDLMTRKAAFCNFGLRNADFGFESKESGDRIQNSVDRAFVNVFIFSPSRSTSRLARLVRMRCALCASGAQLLLTFL